MRVEIQRIVGCISTVESRVLWQSSESLLCQQLYVQQRRVSIALRGVSKLRTDNKYFSVDSSVVNNVQCVDNWGFRKVIMLTIASRMNRIYHVEA